jgi:hypothetical protein
VNASSIEGCSAGSTAAAAVVLAGDGFVNGEAVPSEGSPPEQAANRRSITIAGSLAAVMGRHPCSSPYVWAADGQNVGAAWRRRIGASPEVAI